MSAKKKNTAKSNNTTPTNKNSKAFFPIFNMWGKRYLLMAETFHLLLLYDKMWHPNNLQMQ